MKHCPSCDITKPKDHFSKNSSRYDGLQSHCKVCRAERRKKDYRLNKEREIYVNKKWAEANPDKVKEKAKRHRQSLQGSVYYRNKNAEQRSLRRYATPFWLTQEQRGQIKQIYAHAKDCELVTGEKYHVDHIVPLNGENISGLHVPWNLQVLPADVNLRKGNRYGS